MIITRMIVKPIRVKLNISKISCKNCHHVYDVDELSELSYCEECGIKLSNKTIELNSFENKFSLKDLVEKDFQIDKIHGRKVPKSARFASRIKVKRYSVKTGSHGLPAGSIISPSLLRHGIKVHWEKLESRL
ncbi:MAG: hypothetical protein ACTSVI_10030 [Promethearchaeota archaeon]